MLSLMKTLAWPAWPESCAWKYSTLIGRWLGGLGMRWGTVKPRYNKLGVRIKYPYMGVRSFFVAHVASFLNGTWWHITKNQARSIIFCLSSDQQNCREKLDCFRQISNWDLRKRRSAPRSPRMSACPFSSVVHYTIVAQEKISVQCTVLLYVLYHWISTSHYYCTADFCIIVLLLIDRLGQWVGFVTSGWRRRGAANEAARRSDVTYFIIHRKVHYSDEPSWAEWSAPERTDTRHSTPVDWNTHWPRTASNHPE